jgi:translation initiation factor IF-2
MSETSSIQEKEQNTSKSLEIAPNTTISDLAELLNSNPVDLMKQLMRVGIMANINAILDIQIIEKIATAFGYTIIVKENTQPASLFDSRKIDEEIDLSNHILRAPIITVLGHVDHGKTSVLDAIRESHIAEKETGGITQHIGAYQITYKDQPITFIDTPGHAAFTAMRARGAEITDIAVLVVAADDGIMPQTLEAIDHAKAAKVPIVVAINKCDLENSDPDRIKRQLAENDLLVEDWGGDIICVSVSAKTGMGLDTLLENLLLLAEVSELKANPNTQASGVVIEAKLDKNRGPVATLLVQSGTLNIGEKIFTNSTEGRIKSMFNYNNEKIENALPSYPVEIMGINKPPLAGEVFMVASSEKEAEELLEARKKSRSKISDYSVSESTVSINTGQLVKDIPLIIKTDVQGSAEAIRDSLTKLSNDIAKVSIIHSSSGFITETDLLLASTTNAIVIGFRTSLAQSAKQVADSVNIPIKFYEIIYELIEYIETLIIGSEEVEEVDSIDGHATIRAIFSRSKRSKIAGLYVSDGKIEVVQKYTMDQ